MWLNIRRAVFGSLETILIQNQVDAFVDSRSLVDDAQVQCFLRLDGQSRRQGSCDHSLNLPNVYGGKDSQEDEAISESDAV